MPTPERAEPDFVPVADIEVDAVEHSPTGFTLRGSGADSSEYRLDLHLDMPVSRRTGAVLSELLSQSEWRIWRRARQPIQPPRGRKSRDRDSAKSL